MLPSSFIRCGDIKRRSVEVGSPPTASAVDRQPPLGLWVQPARRIMNCVLSFTRWRRGSKVWIRQFYANLPFEGAMFKMSRGDFCNACQCPTHNEQSENLQTTSGWTRFNKYDNQCLFCLCVCVCVCMSVSVRLRAGRDRIPS